MADKEGTRKIGESYCVSSSLDFCKTPPNGVPVGYTLFRKLETSERTATTVRFTQCEAFTTNSRVPMNEGDEAGAMGGVLSGVNRGYCKPVGAYASTVCAEGHNVCRHDTAMLMNCSGPDGPGNVPGTMIYAKCSSLAAANPDGVAEEKPHDAEPPADGAPESAPAPDEGAAAEAEALAEETRAAEAGVAQAQAEVDAIQRELAWETAKAGVDLAGLADPTPISDGLSAGMSLAEGDFAGAGLSIISMIPFLGDALAKPAKASRIAGKVAKLKDKAAKAAKMLENATNKLKELSHRSKSKPPIGKAPSGGGTPPKGVMISEVPKTFARPTKFRKGVREEVWEKAKGPDGKVRDPLTGQEIKPNDKWDMGHKPGFEFEKHQQSAMERGISREQFLNEHNMPDHYRPELPSSNRSHAGELKTDDYFGP